MIRKIEFDILKGILIITVVLGHTSAKIPYVDVPYKEMVGAKRTDNCH